MQVFLFINWMSILTHFAHRVHAVPFFSLVVIERLERARCASARVTGVSEVYGRARGSASRSLQSLSITVDEKRKGLRAVYLAKSKIPHSSSCKRGETMWQSGARIGYDFVFTFTFQQAAAPLLSDMWWNKVLCCVMLCCVMLCCVVLCCVVLYWFTTIYGITRFKFAAHSLGQTPRVSTTFCDAMNRGE